MTGRARRQQRKRARAQRHAGRIYIDFETRGSGHFATFRDRSYPVVQGALVRGDAWYAHRPAVTIAFGRGPRMTIADLLAAGAVPVVEDGRLVYVIKTSGFIDTVSTRVSVRV